MKTIKQIKLQAQTVVEASIAFLLAIFIFFIVIEFALYFQSMHANQTLSDDINANISSSDKDMFCSNPDGEILNLIENRSKKYLDNKLQLKIDEQDTDILVLKSTEKSLNRDVLTIKIICANSNTGFIVKSDYLYRGFFILRFGYIVSSISSVQTPRF